MIQPEEDCEFVGSFAGEAEVAAVQEFAFPDEEADAEEGEVGEVCAGGFGP